MMAMDLDAIHAATNRSCHRLLSWMLPKWDVVSLRDPETGEACSYWHKRGKKTKPHIFHEGEFVVVKKDGRIRRSDGTVHSVNWLSILPPRGVRLRLETVGEKFVAIGEKSVFENKLWAPKVHHPSKKMMEVLMRDGAVWGTPPQL